MTMRTDVASRVGLRHALHVLTLPELRARWLTKREIADRIGATPASLVAPLSALREAGILECRRGSTGGYRVRRGERITAGDVIRAVSPARRFAPCCVPGRESTCGLCSVLDGCVDSFERAADAIVLIDDAHGCGCAHEPAAHGEAARVG